ncbi:MAG: hypothetical protein WDO14_06300 [Bacteroidota bacterium]
MSLIKIIITLHQPLSVKYGAIFPALETELKRLAADRRFSTTLLYLDDATMMAPFGKGAIPLPSTEKDCKDWVDAIYKNKNPDYLVLFGSQDIFPFQRLGNPLFKVGDDSDQKVPSDLPYASDSPYSVNIADFTNPSRVVGRIPDIPGIPDVNHVKSQVDFILSHAPKPLVQYKNYIGISAETWSVSTDLSLTNIFGVNPNQNNYPPTPNPPPPGVQALTHFINCHGMLLNPGFYGESSGNPKTYPLSLHSSNVSAIQPGTVVSAECCYGAQLYKPVPLPKSVATNYMEKKAAVFMGSSSIAYGEELVNDLADILCQDFLKSILAGASTGRSLLEARQQYIFLKLPHLSPYDLKTIAQFYILGDPSVQPVLQVRDAESTTKNRRINMRMKGFVLAFTIAEAKKIDTPPKTESLNAAIKALLSANNLADSEESVFEIEDAFPYSLSPNSKLDRLKGFGVLPQTDIRFRIFGFKGTAVEITGDVAQTEVSGFRVLMVKEDGENILESRVYVSK